MACNYNYGKNDYILEDCSLFKPQSLNKNQFNQYEYQTTQLFEIMVL